MIIGKLIPAGSGLEYYNKRELRWTCPTPNCARVAQVSDDDLDLASLWVRLPVTTPSVLTCRLSRTSARPRTTKSALPENDIANPEDEMATKRSKTCPAGDLLVASGLAVMGDLS